MNFLMNTIFTYQNILIIMHWLNNVNKILMLLMINNFKKEIKLPSKIKIDCRCSISYWTTSIKEGINWLSFMNIIEYTSEMIDN